MDVIINNETSYHFSGVLGGAICVAGLALAVELLLAGAAAGDAAGLRGVRGVVGRVNLTKSIDNGGNMRKRNVRAALVGLLAAGAVVGVGVSSSAASLPGTGKPAVVIGDKNFAEENILGALYSQALKAKGYSVTLKDNIGTSEITWKALERPARRSTSARCTRACAAHAPIAGTTKNPSSAISRLQGQPSRLRIEVGFTLQSATPFSDSDALVGR